MSDFTNIYCRLTQDNLYQGHLWGKITYWIISHVIDYKDCKWPKQIYLQLQQRLVPKCISRLWCMTWLFWSWLWNAVFFRETADRRHLLFKAPNWFSVQETYTSSPLINSRITTSGSSNTDFICLLKLLGADVFSFKVYRLNCPSPFCLLDQLIQ